MAAKELMTWVTGQKRWLKKHLGKMYSVSTRQLGTPPTKEASRQAANDWWSRKQTELEEQTRSTPPKLPFAIERAKKMADWYQRNGLPEDATRLRDEITAWCESLAAGEIHPRETKWLITMSPEGQAVWADRL